MRPGAFADGPAENDYEEGFSPARRGLRLKISRADIAAFLTRQLSETTYLHRAVAISG